MKATKGVPDSKSGPKRKGPNGRFNRQYGGILDREMAQNGQAANILTARMKCSASGNTPFGIHMIEDISHSGHTTCVLASVTDRRATLLAIAKARFDKGLHRECLCCGGEITEGRLEVQQAVTCIPCQKLVDMGIGIGQLHAALKGGGERQQIDRLLRCGQSGVTIVANLTGGK